MKTLLLILLPLITFGQDTIITKEDTILCEIRSINKESINYLYNKKGSKSIVSIRLDNVIWYNTREEEGKPTISVAIRPGDYLIKAKNSMIKGVVVMGVGALGGGALLSDPDKITTAIALIMGTGLVAFIYKLSAIIQIGKAGEGLNKEVTE